MAAYFTNCNWCGRTFEAQRSTARFCSASHRARASIDDKALRVARDSFRDGVAATLAALAADNAAA